MAVLLVAYQHGPSMRWLIAHESIAVWLTGVFTVVLAISVLVAWSALADAKKTRHSQLVMEFSRRMDSAHIVASRRMAGSYGRDELAALATELFGPGAKRPPEEQNFKDWAVAARYPSLLEAMGVMTKDGSIPRRTVFRMWGQTIVAAWEIWGKTIETLRRPDHLDDTEVNRYFEWLVGAMRSEAQGEPADERGPVGPGIRAAIGP